ncbi:hypothetical protein CGLO_18215 [Colletotrichum gloeosporioides Cg-14]|nr:hypothetical protein CGLO_18215 [Colletotrichum gloeosporioides Cg-14]
MLFGYR